jgi:hypothetical protein
MPSEGPIALEALSTETPVEATSTQPPSTGHKADASLDSQPGAARTPAADSPASVLAAADTLPPKTSPKRIARASLKPKDKGADRIDMTGASLASIANEAQPTPEADLAARTKQRLEAFLSAYASAYESRNVDRLGAFFTEDAVEMGTPFADMTPVYRKNFDRVDSIRYQIRIESFASFVQSGILRVEGRFSSRFLVKGGDWKKRSGTIRFSLVDSKDRLLIRRLDYSLDRPG